MSFLVFPLVDQPNHFVSLAIVKFSRGETAEPVAFVGLFTGSSPMEIASQIERFEPTLGPVEICSGNNSTILPNISITWTQGSSKEFVVKNNNEVLNPRYIFSQSIPKFIFPTTSNCSTSHFSSTITKDESRSLSYGVNWLNFLILILVVVILCIIVYYIFFKAPNCEKICKSNPVAI